jgi:hypothetical protein
MGLETYYRLMLLPYTFGPIRPSDIHTEIEYKDLNAPIQEAIMSLPLVKFTGRFDDGGLDKNKQLYLMTSLKENFIVDTQGADFVRHACRIVGLPDISDKNIEQMSVDNKHVKVLKRLEQYEVTFDGVLYKLEIVEENDETFTSIEHNGRYIMDRKLESDIINFFNNNR